MTQESSLKGQRGEGAAEAYLSWFFRRILPTPPADPVDFVCEHLLTTKGDYNSTYEYECSFQFQVKNRKALNLPVKTSTLNRWLDDVEKSPVFILYLEEVGSKHQNWWFLSLYDWFMRNEERLPTYFGQEEVTFHVKNDAFRECGRDDEYFHEALKEEAKRAAGAPSAIWATLPNYSSFPLNLAQILRFMELAGLEIPFAVATHVSNQDLPRRIRRLLGGEPSGDNRLDRWWYEAHPKLPRISVSNSFQRRQFRLFLTAMDNFRRGRQVQLPGPFRVDIVSCWRNFVTMFPSSINLLRSVVRTALHRNL